MKVSKQDIYNRRELLTAYLQSHEKASVKELADAFLVSPITIRRDLEVLEKQGLLLRYFGGAYIPSPLEADKARNLDIQARKKEAIAKKAASFIEKNQIVFMNSSSTACRIYSYIQKKPVTIITNNSRSILETISPGINLILTGGEVNPNKYSLSGEYALDVISKVTSHLCIIGVSGISIKNGITTSLLSETTINLSMMKNCTGPVVVVADSSKIGAIHSFYSGSIQTVTHLITDTDADPEILEQFRSADIETITVDYTHI